MVRWSTGFEECPVCEGSGFDPKVLSQLPVECPRCKGKGHISTQATTNIGQLLRAAAARIGK